MIKGERGLTEGFKLSSFLNSRLFFCLGTRWVQRPLKILCPGGGGSYFTRFIGSWSRDFSVVTQVIMVDLSPKILRLMGWTYCGSHRFLNLKYICCIGRYYLQWQRGVDDLLVCLFEWNNIYIVNHLYHNFRTYVRLRRVIINKSSEENYHGYRYPTKY